MSAGVIATLLTGVGVLFGVLFGVWRMVDALGARLDARIDAVNARLDSGLGGLNARIDAVLLADRRPPA